MHIHLQTTTSCSYCGTVTGASSGGDGPDDGVGGGEPMDINFIFAQYPNQKATMTKTHMRIVQMAMVMV